MKRFGWKRKIGSEVSKEASSAFENEAKEDRDPSIESEEVDWLSLAPVKKKSLTGLEDSQAKAKRLVQEGSILASSERYWEAMKKWDEALHYLPNDEKIHEMKAQALMELCEVFPAVQSARKAVELAPTWWIAHQTLGRAYLGMGEVKMAVQSFSRAVHLNPGDRELWEEDLLWSQSLLEKRKLIEQEKQELETTKSGVTITEIHSDDSDADEVRERNERKIEVYKHTSVDTKSASQMVIGKLPTNYVQMRDYIPP